MTSLACPICGALTVPDAVKGSYRYYRCGGCGLLFVWPFLTAAPKEIYGADYFGGAEKGFGYVDYAAEKPALDGLLSRYLARMGELLPAKGRLLDVGAATGHFVKLAREHGWEASGIDVSAAGAAAAKAAGLDVAEATLEEYRAPDGAFSAVTLWDVVEHLPDPMAGLRRCAMLLKPGGLLALVTPDAGSLWARLWGKRWHSLVPPEHIFMFTRAALAKALEAAGFEAVETRKPVKSFAPAYIASTFARWTGLRLPERLMATLKTKPFASLSIPVPIRDNLFVLARKRS